MEICAALLNDGYEVFHLYILEICPSNITKKALMLREDYWEQQIKPSYNKQNI